MSLDKVICVFSKVFSPRLNLDLNRFK